MHRIGHVMLSPLLAIQAGIVVTRALRLPEAEGPRHGNIGQGPELRLLIVGDSSAAGVGVSHQDQALAGQLSLALSRHFTVNWRVEARTGVTSAQALQRLQGAAPAPFDVAVVALGVNDATRLRDIRRWLAVGQAMRTHLRDDFGVKRIYLNDLPQLGAFPLLPWPLRAVIGGHATRMSKAQKDAAQHEPDVDLVTFDMPFDYEMMAEDGFHPGAEAYALWAQGIADRIVRDMKFQTKIEG